MQEMLASDWQMSLVRILAADWLRQVALEILAADWQLKRAEIQVADWQIL